MAQAVTWQTDIHTDSTWYPVRMMGLLRVFWIVLCPNLTKYAPIPTVLPTTIVRVKISSYARAVSPAIRPDPIKFSTPKSGSWRIGKQR